MPAVSDAAAAFVDAVQPGLDVTKTALVPVVLDPRRQPAAGPDTPDPRPAEYRYEIGNPGDVPLSLADTPPSDDKCAPLTFVEGDTDGDDLLDPGEVWVIHVPRPAGARRTPTTRRATGPASGGEHGDRRGRAALRRRPGHRRAKHVTGTANAQVQVIEPSLELTKTASADGRAQRQRA